MKHAGVEEFLTSRPEARDCLALLGLFEGAACARMMAAVLRESDPEGVADLEIVFERILEDAERAYLLTREGDHWFVVNEAVEAGFREIFLDWPVAQRESCLVGFVRAYTQFGEWIVGLNDLSSVKARGRLQPEMSHLGRAIGFAAEASNWAAARGMLEAMRIGVDGELAPEDWLFVLQATGGVCSQSADSEGRQDFLTWLSEEHAWFELRMGRLHDARDHAASLEIKQGGREDKAGLLRARRLLGTIALARGNYEEAEAYFSVYLKSDLRVEISEKDGARIVAGLGKALARQGRSDEAEPHLASALLMAEESDDEPLVAELLLELSGTAERRGDYDLATGRARRCLVAYERLDDETGRAKALTRLGSISLEQNRLSDAERFLAESLALWKRMSPGPWIEDAIELVGRLARLRNRPESALLTLRLLRDACEWREDRSAQAIAEAEDARDYLRRRRYQKAHELLRSCIGQLRADNDPERLVWALRQLGRTSAIFESFSVSKRYFEECIELLKRDDRRAELAKAYYQFGKAAECHQENNRASTNYSECLGLARGLDDRGLVSKALARLIEMSRMTGDSRKARDYGALNLDLQMRPGDERGVAGAKFQLGRVAMVRSEFASARDRFVECVEACLAAGRLKDVGKTLKHLTFAGELAARNPRMVKACESYSNPDDFINAHWDTDLLREIELFDETPLQLLRKCLATADAGSELMELRFLVRRMSAKEFNAWAVSMLQQPAAGDDGAAEANAQRWMTGFALDDGDGAAAEERARQWHGFALARGALKDAANARLALGVALEQQGRVLEACKQFRESPGETVCFDPATRCYAGEALCGLGREALFSGVIRQAVNFFEHAHDHLKRHGNRCDAVPALLGLCRSATAVGDYSKAEMWVDLALGISVDASLGWRAAAWCEKARLHLQRGNHGRSLLNLVRALKGFRSLGDQSAEGEALMALGNLFCSVNKPKRAREHFTAALSLFHKLEDWANLEAADQALSALE